MKKWTAKEARQWIVKKNGDVQGLKVTCVEWFGLCTGYDKHYTFYSGRFALVAPGYRPTTMIFSADHDSIMLR